MHLCVDEAIDSGYVLEGGAFPQEWVAACDEWPPRDKGAAPAPAYAPPSDDLMNFPALGATTSPAAPPPAGLSVSPPTGREGAQQQQHLFAPMPAGFLSEEGGGASGDGGAHGGFGGIPGAPQQGLLTPQQGLDSSRNASAASIAAMWGSAGGEGGAPGAALWSGQQQLGAEGTSWHLHNGQPAAGATEQQQQQALLLALLGLQQTHEQSIHPGLHGGTDAAATACEPAKPPSGWAAIAAKPAQFRPAAAAGPSEGGEGGASSSSDPFNLELLPGCRVFSSHSETVVQLHQTSIVTLHANGKMTLTSGGWRTFSTLKVNHESGRSVLPVSHSTHLGASFVYISR